MTVAPTLPSTLPHTLPPCPNARLALFAMRRIGAHGLDDAHAAQAILHRFGTGFRRPLLLLRAFMADLAGNSACPIAIAPCCCARMTPGEGTLIDILARAETMPATARLLLADLLSLRGVDGVLASASAVSTAFADAGFPIRRFRLPPEFS